MKRNHKNKQHKSRKNPLFYTKSGELDLAILFSAIILLVGLIAVFVELFTPTRLPNVAWTFLISSFSTTLIAAVPVNRARILANATMPGSVADAVAKALGNPMASSDVQELTTTKG